MLVITSRIPFPLEKGDKLRVFYQLKHLSKNHRISLIALCESEKEVDAATTALKPYCEDVHFFILPRWKRYISLPLGLVYNLPFSVQYFYNSGIAKKIRNLILSLNPDHIYSQLIRSAPYVRKLPFSKTIDYMDSFSLGARRRATESSLMAKLLMNFEAGQLANYESSVFNDFNTHCIISDQDKQSLKILSRDKIAVIPNGVDTQFFYPRKDVQKQYDFLLCGNMGYYPNVAAAKVLFKMAERLKLKFPDIRILIAGARPDASVLAMDGKNGITVSGWMDDIREAYWSSMINLAPIFTGSGLQNKMLEAMACGLPCLTTGVVADSIGGLNGVHYAIANDEKNLYLEACKLLESKSQRENLAKNGLQLVRNKFDWVASGSKLEKLLLIGSNKGSFGGNIE